MSPSNRKINALKNCLEHVQEAILWHNIYILRKNAVKHTSTELLQERERLTTLMVEALTERNINLERARFFKDKSK